MKAWSFEVALRVGVLTLFLVLVTRVLNFFWLLSLLRIFGYGRIYLFQIKMLAVLDGYPYGMDRFRNPERHFWR